MEKFDKESFKGQWITVRDDDGDGTMTVTGKSSTAFKATALMSVLAEVLRDEVGFDLATAVSYVTASVAHAYGADADDGDDA